MTSRVERLLLFSCLFVCFNHCVLAKTFAACLTAGARFDFFFPTRPSKLYFTLFYQMSLSEIIWNPLWPPSSSSGLSEVQSPRGVTVRVPELRGDAEELKNVPTVTQLGDGLLSFTWPTDHDTPSCTAGATCCSSGWWSTLCVCQPINQMVNDCFLIPPSPPAHYFFPLCICPSTSFSFLRHYLVINFPNEPVALSWSSSCSSWLFLGQTAVWFEFPWLFPLHEAPKSLSGPVSQQIRVYF